MKTVLTSVATLLLGVAILLTGQGLQGTLVPTRAALEQFSTLSIGAIGAVYFLGFTIGCLRGGVLLGAVGHVRVFAAMTALASAAPLLLGMWADPWVWAVLRFLTGFCFAVLYIAIESWLNGSTTNDTRGAVFSIYVFITLTVMALGQLMMLLYDPRQLELFIVASILVSTAAIPIALSRADSPQKPQVVRLDLRRLYEISPTGSFGCLAAGLSNGSFWAVSAIFATRHTGDINSAAWYMTSVVIGGAMFQWPIGLLSDRVGRRKVLAATALGAAVIALLMVYSGASLSVLNLMMLGALWGGMAFPLYSVAVAHTNDFARQDEYVTVSSGLLLLYGMGAVAGPLLASLAMNASGPTGLYVFSAGVHLTLLCYVLNRARKRPPVPSDQRADFSDSLTRACTASTVFERDRVDESPRDRS